MGNVKGSALTARLEFVRREHGQDALAQVIAALEPENRPIVEGIILPSAWVPCTTFIDFSIKTDRLFGNGDLELCKTMGRFAAEANLTTLYKVFYRISSVAFIMSRAASLWRVNHDSGQLSLVESNDRNVQLRIDDYAVPHRAICLSVLGWAWRSIELSGGKNVKPNERQCRARGDATCTMQFEWS